MNILFSCGDYYPNLGGAYSLVDDLAGALLEAGHSVAVLTRLQPGTAKLQNWHNYEIHRIDYPLLYEKFEWKRAVWTRSAPVILQIARLIRRRKITTVCIGLLDMSAWYLLLLRPILRFRLVLYLHGGETRVLPFREPSYAVLIRRALRAAGVVIAVSGELRTEAARHWPGAMKKTQVIQNAIDLRQIRLAAPWTHPRPYFATVGRLVPQKDFATLIRAYAQVQNEIGDVDLVIAGEGKQNGMLRQLAQACPNPDRVVFLGRVERETAISVMRGSLFFVLPSVTEGFPIVAVEALAAGKPFIGSSIPCIAAIVADGRHGELFPPGDVAALAQLLRKYLQNPEYLRNLSAAAAIVDLARYDIDQVAAQHLRLYEAGH